MKNKTNLIQLLQLCDNVPRFLLAWTEKILSKKIQVVKLWCLSMKYVRHVLEPLYSNTTNVLKVIDLVGLMVKSKKEWWEHIPCYPMWKMIKSRHEIESIKSIKEKYKCWNMLSNYLITILYMLLYLCKTAWRKFRTRDIKIYLKITKYLVKWPWPL